MPVEETGPVQSRGECVDCGAKATVTVDPYGVTTEDCRCRDCYELHCSRVYREAALARTI